jgi:hypothetical protein
VGAGGGSLAAGHPDAPPSNGRAISVLAAREGAAVAVAGTKPQDAGLASGLINTTQQVGGALGLAILAAVANAATDNSNAASHLVALNDGFRIAFLVGAGFALAGAILASVLIDSRDSRDAVEAAARTEAPAAVAA